MEGIEFQQLLIARLAQIRPAMGRTALMKLLYFLQVLRSVPLPYHFTLYSYGPFDSQVLYDLSVAQNFGLVEERYVAYSSVGYGYEISPTVDRTVLDDLSGGGLGRWEPDLQWVVGSFGDWSAAQLELAATIVYADRESRAEQNMDTIESLAAAVSGVKPKFGIGAIRDTAVRLAREGMLTSLA